MRTIHIHISRTLYLRIMKTSKALEEWPSYVYVKFGNSNLNIKKVISFVIGIPPKRLPHRYCTRFPLVATGSKAGTVFVFENWRQTLQDGCWIVEASEFRFYYVSTPLKTGSADPAKQYRYNGIIERGNLVTSWSVRLVSHLTRSE
jgi:hypothetical protein